MSNFIQNSGLASGFTVNTNGNELEILGEPGYQLRAGNYLITAGCREVRTIINLIPNENKAFARDKYLLEKLCLPQGVKLHVTCDLYKIELGPLLGVFISKYKVKKLLLGRWDSVYWRFQKWAEQLGGLLYFFTLDDIDWNERTVNGYYWNEQKEWVSRLYPLPKAIYNRCFGKDGRESSRRLQETITRQGLQIQVVNQAVKIGKYETYTHLYQYPNVRKFLPVFTTYKAQELQTYLDNYRSVYLKPNKLYKGEGIVRVTKTQEGYLLKFRDEENNQTLFYKETKSLLKGIDAVVSAQDDYILQTEIDLACCLGNRFDIRVMLQKRKPFMWEVTGINARLAPCGSIITSPRSGGRVLGIKEALAFSFPGREQQFIREIGACALQIGYLMEKKFGFLGELGIDLGLDQKGKLWLIEVNGKPLKVSFNRLKDPALTYAINLAPILLGFALAGFSNEDTKHPIQPLQQNTYSFKRLPDREEQSKRILYLNSSQMEMFQLNPGGKTVLQAGFSDTMVEVGEQEIDPSDSNIYLSSSAFSQLDHCFTKPLSLTLLSKRKVTFQPTVGMLIPSDNLEISILNSYEMKKVALLSWEKGIFFYYFSPENIDWDRELVEAYYLHPHNQAWIREFLPFPQVLYDMATYPYDRQKRLKAKEVNQKLRARHNLQVINSQRYFGKWETFKALSFFKETRSFVPDTCLLTVNGLREYLKKFNRIFIKSNYGSFGREVFKLTREEKSVIFQADGGEVKKMPLFDIWSLYWFLYVKAGRKAIIQQGITLAQWGGKSFDLRVLVQKNIHAEWVISAVSIRIASSGAIVTNVSAGAQEIIVPPGQQLPHNMSWEMLQKFTYKIAVALEASYGTLGEIGLDVGLDPQGRLWLIEANSKPNTIGYRDKTSEKVCDKVYGLPLDYANYLARRMLYHQI